MRQYTVDIIGAGQIGSRHLQALKKVREPLHINVIDPSEQSIATAKKRYQEATPGKNRHTLNYLAKLPEGQKIDLAIIATTSDIRAKVIKDLITKNKVRYLLLEKLLFDKKRDYKTMANIFAKLKIKAWVNCPLKLRPVYKKINAELADQNISFRITGSQLGLASNTVHYLDFIASFLNDFEFRVKTDLLDKKIIPSKRKGFLELNGSLYGNFKKGAKFELISYGGQNAPPLIEIFNNKSRYIFFDDPSGTKAFLSTANNNWAWETASFKNPLVSETTTTIVENILKHGNCALTSYAKSMRLHLNLLEPLHKFVNQNSKSKYKNYPFT